MYSITLAQLSGLDKLIQFIVFEMTVVPLMAILLSEDAPDLIEVLINELK